MSASIIALQRVHADLTGSAERYDKAAAECDDDAARAREKAAECRASIIDIEASLVLLKKD